MARSSGIFALSHAVPLLPPRLSCRCRPSSDAIFVCVCVRPRCACRPLPAYPYTPSNTSSRYRSVPQQAFRRGPLGCLARLVMQPACKGSADGEPASTWGASPPSLPPTIAWLAQLRHLSHPCGLRMPPLCCPPPPSIPCVPEPSTLSQWAWAWSMEVCQ